MLSQTHVTWCEREKEKRIRKGGFGFSIVSQSIRDTRNISRETLSFSLISPVPQKSALVACLDYFGCLLFLLNAFGLSVYQCFIHQTTFDGPS